MPVLRNRARVLSRARYPLGRQRHSCRGTAVPAEYWRFYPVPHLSEVDLAAGEHGTAEVDLAAGDHDAAKAGVVVDAVAARKAARDAALRAHPDYQAWRHPA